MIAPGLQPEPLEYDPTEAIRAVIFGRLSFEDPGTRIHNCRLGQLLADLRALWACLPVESQGRAPNDSPSVSRDWMEWLDMLSHEELKAVLSHEAESDQIREAGYIDEERRIVCQDCGKYVTARKVSKITDLQFTEL